MQRIGKSKVTKIQPKAGVVYPLIRLPKTYVDKIGKTAEIFETEHNKRRALAITFTEQETSEVIQPDPKVIQPGGSNGMKSRILALEKEVSELKSLLLLNEGSEKLKNKKQTPESGFEPESEPRQGSMIGRYTTRASL